MLGQRVQGDIFRYITDKGKRRLLNEIIKSEGGIAMASEVLQAFSKEEIEYFRQLSEYKYEVDKQSKMVEARRAGFADGFAEGFAKGFSEGFAEGFAKGKAEALAKVRQNLEKLGKSAGDIAKVMSLCAMEERQGVDKDEL